MIEFAIALAACALLAGLLAWYDSRRWNEWEELLTAEDVAKVLERKFDAEQRALDGTCARAAAAPNHVDGLRLLVAAAAFLAGLVPERQELLRRLELYARLSGAIARPPRLRLTALQHAFARLRSRPTTEQLDRAREEFRALDAEMLEHWRGLLSASRGLDGRSSSPPERE